MSWTASASSDGSRQCFAQCCGAVRCRRLQNLLGPLTSLPMRDLCATCRTDRGGSGATLHARRARVRYCCIDPSRQSTATASSHSLCAGSAILQSARGCNLRPRGDVMMTPRSFIHAPRSVAGCICQRAGAVAEVAVAAGPSISICADSSSIAHAGAGQGRAGQAELDSGAAVMLVGEWFGCCSTSPQTAQVGDDFPRRCPDGCCSRRRDAALFTAGSPSRLLPMQRARPIWQVGITSPRGGRSESRVFGRSRSHRPSRTRAEIPVLDPPSMELKPVADKGTHRPARNLVRCSNLSSPPVTSVLLFGKPRTLATSRASPPSVLRLDKIFSRSPLHSAPSAEILNHCSTTPHRSHAQGPSKARPAHEA